MDCLFCLASLFIQVDTGYQYLNTPPRGQYSVYDRNEGSPILSAFRVGFETDLTRNVTIAVLASHESMPTIKEDKGVNAVWVRGTWRPFK